MATLLKVCRLSSGIAIIWLAILFQTASGQSVSANSDGSGIEAELLAAPAPSTPAKTVPLVSKPVYRFFSPSDITGGGFYLTDDPHDSLTQSMTFRGIAFNVLTTDFPGSTPLYTCQVHDADYVVSTDECDPKKFISIKHIGYLFIEKAPNTVPVSFCWNIEKSWHNATIDPDKDCPSPAVVEFILGYAPK